MKRSLVVLAVASLVFAGVASAEVKSGDIQLDFLAGWTQQNISGDIGGGHTSVFFGAIRPGLAVTDNIRAAVVGAVAYEDTTNVGHATIWAFGVSAEYVFMPANQLNPYVGGEIAWADADIGGGVGSSQGWLFAPRAGVLFTLNRTNNLFAEYQYQMYTGDINKVVNNGHMILLGIEHKFKAG